MSIRIITFLCILMALSGCAIKQEKADLIIHNAVIYTLNENLDKAQALAICDGRIVEVGAERQIMNKYRADRVIDARLMPVYPGFIDAHCHFLGYGKTLNEVNLTGTNSFDEVLERVNEFSRLHPEGWIIGRGWDQNDWDVQQFPTRIEIDSLFPDRPVALRRIDGHAMLCNSTALELAGITADTRINGGQVLLENDVPSGVLIDNAMSFVNRVMPEDSDDALTRALIAAQEKCFAVGLTTVDDAGLMQNEVELIDQLHNDGLLKMRVYAMLSDDSINFSHYLKSGPYQTDHLNVRSFKFYADGALGSRGACLLEPYADMPGQQGFLLDSISYFEFRARQLLNAGFQMNTHCIGDSANKALLEVYAKVLDGANDYRWRIEHAQVLRKADRHAFATHSIVPSVQPTHATSDMYWAGERLGRGRIHRAYAYRSLKEELGVIALGTDFPVEDISPIKTFYAAVARKDLKGYPEGGFQSDQALDRIDALLGMTLWAAVANFEEDVKGTIEVGKYADLVVLDRDLLLVSEDNIPQVTVLFTVVDGEIVYEAK